MTDSAIALDPTELPDSPTGGDLRERVVAGIGVLLPRVLKREVPMPAENACLFDELGLTSASTLELLLELEERLDIQIDVEDIDQDDLRSLGALADFVTDHAITED
ncbi:phosphopantetheine-binding protein [Kitasatospora sp. NBC_01287]|uniref:phosphopantetheine-binding protein n=1 Tax=Kitasatospora sp. NBC_01287 TaxID=2903573 RepID=UPI0022575E9A|nr:phosphopantetheine-binding protein [Kitasatospora sp. NBC_01287]MCX4744498.1 phosphopantetheine-binding protein [Kitasatospora sp. NBC_01287]